MKLKELKIDTMYDETIPADYAVRGKVGSAEFIYLLERDKEVTVDASQITQTFVKAIPCGEYGSRVCDAKEGTRGAFWITSCDISATRPLGQIEGKAHDKNN